MQPPRPPVLGYATPPPPPQPPPRHPPPSGVGSFASATLVTAFVVRVWDAVQLRDDLHSPLGGTCALTAGPFVTTLVGWAVLAASLRATAWSRGGVWAERSPLLFAATGVAYVASVTAAWPLFGHVGPRPVPDATGVMLLYLIPLVIVPLVAPAWLLRRLHPRPGGGA